MRRFRFQYSLSTLLTATALCSIFFALFSIYHHRCMRRRAVIDHFRTKGDAVTVAFKAPSWLRRVLGDLYFEELTDLAIRKRPITANDLNHLRTIASVRTLEISDAGLSDADLLSLSDTDVRVTLDLPGNRITGFGLAGIARSHILFLNLERNPLNDKGFQSMPRMPSIESLNVNGARLTDKGIPALEKLPALKDLSLSCPGVGDAGIAALKCCPGLVFLGLERTRVTDCGLLSLKSLGRLRDVGLTGSCVTAQGMRQFRNSMPSMIREPAEDDPDYDASHADWVKRTEELLQAIPVPTK